MPTPEEELKDLLELIGPKRVDTKEVEIEAHDPMMMQKLLERRKSKPVTFGEFVSSRVQRYGSKTDCPQPSENLE